MYTKYKGIVRSWNKARGFGFIRALDSKAEFYFHHSDVRSDENLIDIGALVEFVSNSVPPQGKTLALAASVRVVEASPRTVLGAGLSTLAQEPSHAVGGVKGGVK